MVTGASQLAAKTAAATIQANMEELILILFCFIQGFEPCVVKTILSKFQTNSYASKVSASWLNSRKSTGVTAETPCSGI